MAVAAGVRRGGEETGGGTYLTCARALRVGVCGCGCGCLLCGRGHRRAWAGGAALSGASGRASKRERGVRRQQADLARQGPGCAAPPSSKQASMPYAAAAAGSGAVVDGPARGEWVEREGGRKGGREERERCAHLHRWPG